MHRVLFVGISPEPPPGQLNDLAAQILALLWNVGVQAPLVWMEPGHSGLFIQVGADQADFAEGALAVYLSDRPLAHHTTTVHLTDRVPDPLPAA